MAVKDILSWQVEMANCSQLIHEDRNLQAIPFGTHLWLGSFLSASLKNAIGVCLSLSKLPLRGSWENNSQQLRAGYLPGQPPRLQRETSCRTKPAP